MQTLSRYALIGAALLGLAMIGIGVVFITKGFEAKAEIEAALLKENVTTSEDASIPGVLVKDAATARAQQDTIEGHTYGNYGPYSEMERDDPNRETYLKGLTLRNSLNMAVMGFGVADLALGTGAMAIILGLATIGIAAPALSLASRPEHRTKEVPGIRTAPAAAND